MKRIRIFLIWAVLFLGCFSSQSAKADITITPTKVIFEEGDRFKEVTLVNTSNETKTYDMGWQFFRMIGGTGTATGATLETIENSLTDFDLSQHMVFTPRRVTLLPGAKQKIRLALRRPAGVADGEYRAHLQFKALRNDIGPQTETDEAQAAANSAAVKINVSYTIPVIFRAGIPAISGKITDVKFSRNATSNRLEALVTVARGEGPYGVLGHMYIYDHTGKVIGEVGNAHVYSEVSDRVFKVPLIDESNLSGGDIKIVLEHYSKDPALRYDERSIPVR